MIVDAVLPVFLMMALGFLFLRLGLLTAELATALNRLVYYVALPCLLFHKIGTQDLVWSAVGSVLAAFFLALLLTISLAYLTCRWKALDTTRIGTFVQASYRGNLGFIGLPIILFSSDQSTFNNAESLAAISLAPTAIAFNIIAVFVLTRCRPDQDPSHSRVLSRIATNPLILAGFLGVMAAISPITLPGFLERSLVGLSQMAIPLALLGLGASFAGFSRSSMKQGNLLTDSILCATLKTLISPGLGLLCAVFLGLDAVEARVVMIYLATPTAIASFVMVGHLGGDQQLAATSIVFATLASVVSLPLSLMITQPQSWQAILDWFDGLFMAKI